MAVALVLWPSAVFLYEGTVYNYFVSVRLYYALYCRPGGAFAVAVARAVSASSTGTCASTPTPRAVTSRRALTPTAARASTCGCAFAKVLSAAAGCVACGAQRRFERVRRAARLVALDRWVAKDAGSLRRGAIAART